MIGWLTGTAFAVSLLIGLVLLLRRPVAQAFGARAAYALWAAPLIRAVTPPLPAAAIPEPVQHAVGAVDYQLFIVPSEQAVTGSILPLILTLWLAPAIAYLAWQLWRHHRFVAAALASGEALDVPGVDYDVIASGAVAGPVATGLVHPLIFVPLDFAERYDPEQQRLALLHEQLHHRRGDIWACAAALVLTALMWFNPLAHLALRRFPPRYGIERATPRCSSVPASRRLRPMPRPFFEARRRRFRAPCARSPPSTNSKGD